MGSPTIEAFHRLAAPEDSFAAGRREEGEAELERALAFYCSVAATAYLARASCSSQRPLRVVRQHVRMRAGLIVAAAAALLTAPTANGAVRTRTDSFRSKALDSDLHYLIQLPAGYATSGASYPVVYFLHGLPAGPDAYKGVAWIGQVLAKERKPAILVVPQGTRRKNGDPEYHDWGPGHNWATALAVELPRWIDSHYRTIANRGGRAIIGLSAGGYGAASLGLSHPAIFSVVESWSGYFEPTDPTGTKILDLGSEAANDAASIHKQATALEAQFDRYPTFFGFYVGRSDPTFVSENVELNRELTSAGVPHVYATYPGGHSNALWSAEAPYWLMMALNHLS